MQITVPLVDAKVCCSIPAEKNETVFGVPGGYAGELCPRMIAARFDIQWRAIVYPVQVPPNWLQT